MRSAPLCRSVPRGAVLIGEGLFLTPGVFCRGGVFLNPPGNKKAALWRLGIRKPRTFPCRVIDAHPAVKFLQKTACGLRGLRGALGWRWRARRLRKNPAALCASSCRAMTPCVRLLPCRGTALWCEPADLHRTGLCLIRSRFGSHRSSPQSESDGHSGDCVQRSALSTKSLIPRLSQPSLS